MVNKLIIYQVPYNFVIAGQSGSGKTKLARIIVKMLYEQGLTDEEEAVKELLTKYITSYEKEDYYRWAVILKETGECIGQIAYFLVDNKNHFAEIEY